MAQRTALALVFLMMLAVLATAYAVLIAAHASEGLLVLVYIVVLIGGAHATSSVVVRYDASGRRRR